MYGVHIGDIIEVHSMNGIYISAETVSNFYNGLTS